MEKKPCSKNSFWFPWSVQEIYRTKNKYWKSWGHGGGDDDEDVEGDGDGGDPSYPRSTDTSPINLSIRSLQRHRTERTENVPLLPVLDLFIDKANVKEKTYVWMSVQWKTGN
jgi:hypothetical protein